MRSHRYFLGISQCKNVQRQKGFNKIEKKCNIYLLQFQFLRILMHIMYPLAHKKQAIYRILEKKCNIIKLQLESNIMMVVVSRLIGKKVENYLFKVGETRQTSTRHVQNIR